LRLRICSRPSLNRFYFAADAPLSLIGCHSNAVLDITGLTTYGSLKYQSLNKTASCPYTKALGLQLEAMCDGQPRCYISNDLLQLSKEQCPGVSSVFLDVDCKHPGIYLLT